MSNKIAIKQRWRFDVVDEDTGIIEHTVEKDNVITDAGITAMAARIIGDNNSKFYSHCGIGQGSRLETAADTDLELPLTNGRVAISDKSAYSGTARMVTRFPRTLFSGTDPIQVSEGGLFDAASGGNLLARVVTQSPVELASNKAVNVTVTLSMSAV